MRYRTIFYYPKVLLMHGEHRENSRTTRVEQSHYLNSWKDITNQLLAWLSIMGPCKANMSHPMSD